MDKSLVDLFRHNLWANLRLLDVCASLGDEQLDASAPGTFGRVCDTLVHILAAEERYSSRFTGQRPEQPLRVGQAFPGFEELRRHARRSGEELIEQAPRIDPTQVLAFTSQQGRSSSMQAGILLVQAINHATEHRAHVVTILSQLGIDPPALDGWAYGRELGVVELGT